MGQVLHGSARTTEAVRRAIQHSKESLRVLAKRYGINQKTVAKWKKRTAVKDLPTGPKGECQEFRVRAGIKGKKETRYVPTQRACDTERV
ncbi:hypothetical protein SM191_19695, partial [Sphingomonas sp. 2378]